MAAVLVLCGLLAVVVWLILRQPSKPHNPVISTTPPVSQTEQADSSITEMPSPTVQPAVTPTVITTDSNGGAVTAIPKQSYEERSEILSVISIVSNTVTDSNTDTSTDTSTNTISINGSYAVRFVNNTKVAMYGAYFNISGFNISCAMLGGVSARYSILNEGEILLIPFVQELLPFDSVELYFEFSTQFAEPELEMAVLPYMAYSTVFDIASYVYSDIEIGFSNEVAQIPVNGFAYGYRLSLTGINKLEIPLGKE